MKSALQTALDAIRAAVVAAFEPGPLDVAGPAARHEDLLRGAEAPAAEEGAAVVSRFGWRQLAGPLATVVALAALEVSLRAGLPIGPAAAAALLLVFLSALVGGLFAGLLAAALMAVHLTYFLLVPGRIAYAGQLRPFVVLLVVAPTLALLPGRLRRWWHDFLREGGAKTDDGALDATFLAETSALLDTSIGYRRTLAKISELAVPTLADWIALYVVGEEGVPVREVVAHSDPAAGELLARVFGDAPLTLNQRHPLVGVDEVLEKRAATFIETGDHTRLAPYARNQEERAWLRRLTPTALIGVPLLARGRLIGAMVFARVAVEENVEPLPFRPHDLALAEEFCRRAALAADTARLYDTAIEARREAENASERVVNILESISDGFMALDRDWCFTYVNGEAERLLGRSRADLIGTNIWRQFPRSVGTVFYRAYNEAATTQTATHFEAEAQWSGDFIWVEVHAFPSKDGLSVYFRDISSRKAVEDALKRSEEQLRHSQKMEAVGRLAGGVAHDFNNLLTSIAGHTELLLRKAEPGSELEEDLREIQRSAGRAGDLTRQLLAFGRRQVHAPQVLDLNGVVRDLEKMLRRLIGENIVLETNLLADIPAISADPGQLEQVIMNLVVNARDAMAGGGMLSIETSTIELEQDALGNFTDTVQAGAYVVLSLTDTGTGIKQDTLSHIFEPFFTTKDKGKGTGLGLATVYGIVKQGNGNIAVYTRPGKGTRFEIYFPVAGAPLARPEPRHAPEPREEIPAGEGTILVAEDEAAVRNFVCKVLRERGFTVLEAADGVEALDIAAAHAAPIQMLLSDVVMPEMGGRELAGRLGRLRPDMKIVFMSGYAENEIVHQGALDEGTNLIEKPFSAGTLARRVLDALSEDGVPA